MPADAEPALRILADRAALIANCRRLQGLAGVPLAAAVKADGYGLGARAVVDALRGEGVTEFLVSSWAEAEALGRPDLSILVLHGFHADDAAAAARLPMARPVLNSMAQVAGFHARFPGRPADLMVETGMHRLGLAASEVAEAMALVPVATIHSHLACADSDHALTRAQLAAFRAVVAATPGVRHSLANSAGICLGADFAFDAVRAGIGLYGGTPRAGFAMQRVATPEARVLQVKAVPAGASVGYGATWTAPRDSRVATLNIGYADGVPRALAGHLIALSPAGRHPVIGRISMDLTAIDATAGAIAEGDWLALDWDIDALAAASGISPYELLTGLSRRAPRIWR